MARYYGVPLRNGLPIGLGSVLSLRKPGASGPAAGPPVEYLVVAGGGWEINEGSQGTFYFDLNSNTIDFSYGLNNESSVSKELYEVNLNL